MMEKTKTKELLVWGVPEKLKLQFKIKCVQSGKTMRQVILEMMEKYIHD